MKGKKTVLKELLFYFCDLCEEHGIEYSFIGEPALEVLRYGALPSNFNRLAIAIPYGQLQKLISLVNDDPDSLHSVRYVVNHPVDFTYLLMDPAFMTVRFTSEKKEDIKPAYLTVLELEKDVPKRISKRFDTILEYINDSDWDFKEVKTSLRMAKWKTKYHLGGKERFLRNLFKERGQAMGLSDWKDVCKQELVALRKNKIPGKLLKEVRTVDMDGHFIRIAPVLTDLAYTKDCYFNIKQESRYQMDLGPVPPAFFDDADISGQIKMIQSEAESYFASTLSVTAETDIITHMWDTYKMTVDVKRFEDDYDRNLINEITGCLDNHDLDKAKELLKPYTKAKRKYIKKEVQFIENPKIEPLVDWYERLKNEQS